jgi:hypothetical protein
MAEGRDWSIPAGRRACGVSMLACASVLGLEIVGLFLSNITIANGGYFQILVCAQVAFIVAVLIAAYQVIMRSGAGRWVLLVAAIVPGAMFFATICAGCGVDLSGS